MSKEGAFPTYLHQLELIEMRVFNRLGIPLALALLTILLYSHNSNIAERNKKASLVSIHSLSIQHNNLELSVKKNVLKNHYG